jgi:hypothetical protein
MQKMIVSFLFALSTINASEGQQADVESKKPIQYFEESENPPCAVPFFCTMRRPAKSLVPVVLAYYSLSPQEAKEKKNQ